MNRTMMLLCLFLSACLQPVRAAMPAFTQTATSIATMVERHSEAIATEPTETEAAMQFVVCNTTIGLNVRSSAAVTGPILRTLMPGARVAVYETVGKWARVGMLKSEWVNNAYLCK